MKMCKTTAFLGLGLVGCALAQQVGTQTAEVHPKMAYSTCDKNGCTTSNGGEVVLDANWRWLHTTSGYTNCYTGNEWDATLCPDPKTCATNCAVDGADYEGTYGITTDGETMELKFVTKGQYSTNIGGRTYLMESEDKYKMFKLKNQEFTFTVDVSNLPCGLNGALYLVEMPEDGGMGNFPANKAGAKYGTGYCDGQCPHDLKFINGEANVLDWKPSPNDKNSGTGKYGTCCNEMDIWEANSISSAYTPHVCTKDGRFRCEGTDCGDNSADERYKGVCDKDGCDLNAYRMGDHTFFGPGSSFKVDTTQPFTVTTQFLTADNTTAGDLVEIRRLYTQNGKTISQPAVQTAGMKPYDSVSDAFCNDQKKAFGDNNDFEKKGGLKAMGEALERGMVLVMSMWDDHEVNMLWLDSDYPTDAPTTQPGISRGSCSIDSGKPDDVEKNHPDSSVKYGKIKVGDIGTTL